MSTGNQKRTRSQRVASVAQPKSWWGQLLGYVQQGRVVVRLGACAIVAIVLLVMARGWDPPKTFFEGQTPVRDIIARTTFEQIDKGKTEEARRRERRLAFAVFDCDPEPVAQLGARLRNDINVLATAKSLTDVDSAIWSLFDIADPDGASTSGEPLFERLRIQLAEEGALESFLAALDGALSRMKQDGLLDALPTDHDANFQHITVRTPGGPERNVLVEDVLIEQAARRLETELLAKMPSQELAAAAFRWLRPQLPVTLTVDVEATRKAQEAAAEATPPELRVFSPEPSLDNLLARAGEPLDAEAAERLDLEHAAILNERTWVDRLERGTALFGMYVALYTLCGFYVYFRNRALLNGLRRLVTLLVVIVATVGASLALAETLPGWQTELVALVLFGMISTIAYQQELALLFSAAVVLVFVMSRGQTLADALVLLAATSGAILMLDRVRSRSKLLVVGVVAAAVAFFTAIGVGTLEGMPLAPTLLAQGGRLALWAVVAGSLMTCILPFVERVFGVQTDISLIELGDPAHPLLQELIRRAPGTYNHSITVASLAEAAADAIGARSLLVRVGAYFHDIGKMLKPGYFIENQSQGDNRHESLVPAMSTLVIIAHVKDGADLARQHRLPESIIDFIQQHHGTTLVEFFFNRASQKQAVEGGDEVDESSFRYPGPRPQSKETAVLMLADAVESASRVLVEPTPSRIESLVREISMKRLLDGQFNECDLTLEEVRTVEESLVKSLTAVYHGRVKYMEPETA